MGERCMCVFTGCSHTCVKCVCVFFPFYQGLVVCACFFATVRCMCALKALTLFFFSSWAWRHFLVPPSAQTSSLFLCRFFFHSSFLFFFKLSSAVHWFRLRLPLPFLCLFRIHYPDFSPPSFLPDSQAAAVPNSLALHFFKATF